MTAVQLLASHFSENDQKVEVASATDAGDVKRTRDTGRFLNVPISIVEKHRLGNQDRVEALSLIGEVKGKTALIVDDEIGTGGTVVATAEALKQYGASKIYCAVTHPVLSGTASAQLEESDITKILVTDTLPLTGDKLIDKMEVLSVAPMLGEAIHRIHSGLSVGAMFEAIED